MVETEIFHAIVEYIIVAIEVVVVLLIAGIVIIAIARLLRLAVLKGAKKEEEDKVVHLMLKGLLLALDFLIAADLLETILDPTTGDLTKLAIIVVIKILLTWSLGKELRQPEYLKGGRGGSDAPSS